MNISNQGTLTNVFGNCCFVESRGPKAIIESTLIRVPQFEHKIHPMNILTYHGQSDWHSSNYAYQTKLNGGNRIRLFFIRHLVVFRSNLMFSFFKTGKLDFLSTLLFIIYGRKHEIKFLGGGGGAVKCHLFFFHSLNFKPI